MTSRGYDSVKKTRHVTPDTWKTGTQYLNTESHGTDTIDPLTSAKGTASSVVLKRTHRGRRLSGAVLVQALQQTEA